MHNEKLISVPLTFHPENIQWLKDGKFPILVNVQKIKKIKHFQVKPSFLIILFHLILKRIINLYWNNVSFSPFVVPAKDYVHISLSRFKDFWCQQFQVHGHIAESLFSLFLGIMKKGLRNFVKMFGEIVKMKN